MLGLPVELFFADGKTDPVAAVAAGKSVLVLLTYPLETEILVAQALEAKLFRHFASLKLVPFDLCR